MSTDRQGERGLELDVQDAAVRAYCRQHGHRIVAVCRDEGVSGSNGLQDRLGLAEALRLLRRDKPTGRRQADGLVVYRLDRLARDLIVQEHLLAEVWQADAEVLSTASGEAGLRDDPEDPSRRMIRQVLGAVAEYERAMTVLRLRRGRAHKAEQGGFAYGSPGFGWRSRDGVLVEDPEDPSRRNPRLCVIRCPAPLRGAHHQFPEPGPLERDVPRRPSHSRAHTPIRNPSPPGHLPRSPYVTTPTSRRVSLTDTSRLSPGR
ncbi:MAG: recombinase family protein, partial [Actinomycetota bacterium]|nr:recombinase family protein [Actinomycetota bacterium]